MITHLRALYLSIVICAGIAAGICQFSSSQTMAEFALRNLGEAAIKNRPHGKVALYRDALVRGLIRLVPYLGTGLIAGVLLRAIRAWPQRSRATPSRRERDQRRRAVILPDDSLSRNASPVEREALARLADDPDMPARLPANPDTPCGERLATVSARDWQRAAGAFGQGSLEAQLAILRHLGKVVAFAKGRDGYEARAEAAPLAMQALREMRSFRDLPDDARRQLLQALYALQTGWMAQDLVPRVGLALRNVRELDISEDAL